MENNRRDPIEHGFALIELMVVIMIIGILAAIAIPSLMMQSQKAGNGKARSDLRNIAVAQEAYLTSNPASYATAVQLLAAGPVAVSKDDTVYVYTSTANGFCLVGHAANSSSYVTYDSEQGGLRQALATSLLAAQNVCTNAGYAPAGSFVNDASGLRAS